MALSYRAAALATALSASFVISCSSDEANTDTGTSIDGAVADTGPDASTGNDTGAVDTGVVDTGVVDTGVVDTGADTGIVDSGLVDTGLMDTGVVDTGMMAPFELTTTAFNPGDMIPLRYECSAAIGNGPGDNVSPQLSWTEGPATTMSYAIVMDDIDANFIHWVIYDIPPAIRDIAESVPAGYEPAFPAGAKQAEIQGSRYFGYFGPCSPGRINTYRWTVYAIPTATLTGATRQTSENAAARLVVQQGVAMASFTGES